MNESSVHPNDSIKLFLDTNILADLLLNRQPFAQYSLILLSEAPSRGWKLSTSALSIANLMYLLRKQPKSIQRDALKTITDRIEVLDLTISSIENAFNWAGNDTEDGIQISIAHQHKQSLILTRDLSGFLSSPIQVNTPQEFLRSQGY
jgi:predicted nucleic acid-binding protein